MNSAASAVEILAITRTERFVAHADIPIENGKALCLVITHILEDERIGGSSIHRRERTLSCRQGKAQSRHLFGGEMRREGLFFVLSATFAKHPPS